KGVVDKVRYVRMLGLCLAAVFAVVAVMATSASALPEWGKCENVGSKGGRYTDSNCTKKAKKNAAGEFLGELEFRKAPDVGAKRVAEGKSKNVPFSGANVGSGGVLTTGALRCDEGTHETQLVPRHTCIEGGGKVFYGGEEGVSVECTSENNTGETLGTKGVTN